ncbi:DUF975 family protein [Ihubacter massiliensis]|uniref:DUF975 family protein n=1 Tax=Hominibacterium faecale TaxID=2839743 RepID=A0A9J6QT30_9FIRM|nr:MULTISPECIES: DUF975 family protein [Eubacteriales Family XIII. Incertae Sedis]MCO7120935.1 DUF975 family protein [Ihubacter massiliensis]MCU7377851.1 DUF975 family protein [Hominibacterium faecale]MDE8732885.1 DUF975 family protein [Eubacteriales bacterium DFI.9.88]
MWSRKELKAEAKANLKKNYWAMVAVCFLMAILIAEYSLSTETINYYDSDNRYSGAVQNEMNSTGGLGEEMDHLLPGSEEQLQQELHPTKGVFSSVFNMLGKSKATANNILRTINSIAADHGGFALMIALLAVALAAFYEIFIKAMLRVGERRFFLENHLYHKTHIGRIFFLFKEKKFRRPAWVMLVKAIYLFLWSLTIVGGIIKHYSYKMIPYILAENPDIDRRQAFKLSREMMNGNKWKAFVLDLSFIGWNILMSVTFGILGIFFLNPYVRGVEANLYLALRATAIARDLPGADALNDDYLAAAPADIQEGFYPGQAQVRQKKIALDYHRHYTLINLVLFFFIAAFIGWCWEVALHLVKDGIFVNRGTMLGPWLPIYGVGGVASLIILKRFVDRPSLLFVLTMALCGVVEYFTSWYLEMTKGIKWWDYSGYLLNLNGRICLEGLLTFAIAGCAFIYLIAPKLDTMLNRIPKGTRFGICGILILLFGADTVYSHFHPNTGEGITDYGMLAEPERSAASGQEASGETTL